MLSNYIETSLYITLKHFYLRDFFFLPFYCPLTADGHCVNVQHNYVRTIGFHKVKHTCYHVVSACVPTVSGWCQGKRWRRRLMLCRELSRGRSSSHRRHKTSPAITSLGMSRYTQQHAPTLSATRNSLQFN